MEAEIIAIGSELLTPYRSDTNSLFITAQLNEIGIDVVSKTIIGDERERLINAISLAWERSALVILIGGLGPTEDDLTRDCAAAALGRSLHIDQSIIGTIEARFRSRGLRMAEINLRQAMVIDGASVIENPRGTAPGLWIQTDGKVMMLLPGPPRELCAMFETQCIPRLREVAPRSAIRTRVLRMTGITESAADEIAAPIYTRYANPVTTILTALGEIQLHLKSFGRDEAEALAPLHELSAQLETALGKYIFSTTGESLEEVVGNLLREHGAALAVAESCTGGLLAQRITSVPGSSSYFWGGVVCYDNTAKTHCVGVPKELIESRGAVSSEVASALAEGIRRRAGTTFGIGITGIAGPGGGTAEKPVGLVYIALAEPHGAHVLERRFPGDREVIRSQAAQAGLDMLRRALIGSKSEPRP
ncbi:MAG: competence/damage-inducible protein A [Acidobacteria bacterium]|nr:competence/damage-inducible protein A [Acidobacteriota bacterium]